MVLLLLPRKVNKLQLHWRGPYKVVEKVHDNNFRIKIHNKIRTYHANMLKKYNIREEVNSSELNLAACVAMIVDECHDDQTTDEDFSDQV